MSRVLILVVIALAVLVYLKKRNIKPLDKLAELSNRIFKK